MYTFLKLLKWNAFIFFGKFSWINFVNFPKVKTTSGLADKIALSAEGGFLHLEGAPADAPASPATPQNSILLKTLWIPPYTNDIHSISVSSEDHKRFTMKDIGKIQCRVKNLERVTSFNVLEMQTSMENIKDADGLDRFKSGFVTDNFRGHKVGNVLHDDYKIGVDRTTGTLRPQHNSKFDDISLNTSTSTGYQKTSCEYVNMSECNFSA